MVTLYRLMRETYFEDYYGQIERFTFKSVIIPLTLEEIRDLKSLFMSDAGLSSLESVESKIDEGIASVRRKAGRHCKAFVRLSSRPVLPDGKIWIPSFPWIAPGWRVRGTLHPQPGSIQRLGRDQILQRSVAEP